MELCKLCGKPTSQLHKVMEAYVIAVIKKQNPEWVESDGSCPTCIDVYKRLHAAGRQAVPEDPAVY